LSERDQALLRTEPRPLGFELSFKRSRL